jgi:hypothetical protein
MTIEGTYLEQKVPTKENEVRDQPDTSIEAT